MVRSGVLLLVFSRQKTVADVAHESRQLISLPKKRGCGGNEEERQLRYMQLETGTQHLTFELHSGSKWHDLRTISQLSIHVCAKWYVWWLF